MTVDEKPCYESWRQRAERQEIELDGKFDWDDKIQERREWKDCFEIGYVINSGKHRISNLSVCTTFIFSDFKVINTTFTSS